MEILFIGTGSGKTNLNRYHSSLIIKNNNNILLIDAGDGVSRALISQGVGFKEIDSILLTHYHADHFSGIASLITQMKLVRRNSPLKVYTHAGLADSLRSFLNLCYVFEESLDFKLTIIPFESGVKISLNERLFFIAERNQHIKDKYGLAGSTGINFISCSILIGDNEKNVFYSSDIGSADDLYLFEEFPIDVMISETAHLSAELVFDGYLQIKPEKLILTHIDEPDEKKLIEWHKSLNEADKEKIIIAYDGYKIIV